MAKRPTKERGDGRLPLTVALTKLKEKYPWAPVWALRKKVTSGGVPAIRSSLGSKARYYVTMDDLERVLLAVEVKP
jgi:hypothetical protein